MMGSGRAFAGMVSLAAGLCGLTATASAADIYGLVIGVDDYQYVNKLDGAVNDAKDIAQALHKLNAKEVKLLLDRDADRDSINRAWTDIVAKAKPGDTVFLTFAGHGAQAKDASGVVHQFVVLPGFNVKGEGTYQRILDAEFGDALRAVPKLNVVFVVDSCHAGTMTRGYAKPKFKVRAVTVAGLEDDKLASTVRGLPAGGGDKVLPNVVHLGAVQPQELDPEILIDEQPRGALSFAVARALEGAADINHDGQLEPEELEGFVRGVIGVATDGEQHPTVVVRKDWNVPMKRDAAASAQPAAKDTMQSHALRLAIVNAASPEALVKKLTGAQLAPDDAADLTWDVARGEISSHLGDVVSYASGGDDGTRAFQRATGPAAQGGSAEADLPRVQKVVDKMLLVQALKAEAAKHAIAMGLSPDDKLHHAGDQLTYTVQPQTHTYLTLFNLSSDGTVNFLYPQDDGKNKDPLQIPAGKPYSLELKVQPPFGADHLVAITSAEPLPELHQRLAALDNKAASRDVAEALVSALKGKTFEIGVHPSFTAPAK